DPLVTARQPEARHLQDEADYCCDFRRRYRVVLFGREDVDDFVEHDLGGRNLFVAALDCLEKRSGDLGHLVLGRRHRLYQVAQEVIGVEEDHGLSSLATTLSARSSIASSI